MAVFVGYVEHETDKAILFQDHFWEGPEWFPTSQLQMQRDYTCSLEVIINVADWLCDKNDIKEATGWEETSTRQLSSETL